MDDLYITTSIPYVNGSPHLGHALEFVQVDALARHRRRRGGRVRVQSGTDDHAIKNVSAAAAAGVRVADLVGANGDRFVDLAAVLDVRTDAFLRTSRDPRHAPGVAALWRACGADLHTKGYSGRYCPGCEQFYAPEELDDGSCVEHRTPLVEVTETNWFFRLSRYRDRIAELITSGRLDITPAERRNEVLGFLAGDVHDLSVSRPLGRTGGWGIRVPGDPDQVVYVWFDALANYLTGLDGAGYHRWWAGEAERVHVIGKGIVRFHAVYWIAFLLSAGLPLPTRVLVHDYLTVNGEKIAKSGARLVAAYNRDLANTLGNLASRALALSRRGTVADAGVGDALRRQAAALPAAVDRAVSRFDLRSACTAIIALAEAGNRFIEAEAPWRPATPAGHLDAVVDAVLHACRVAADELAPFVPGGAARLAAQLGAPGTRPAPAFPRITDRPAART